MSGRLLPRALGGLCALGTLLGPVTAPGAVTADPPSPAPAPAVVVGLVLPAEPAAARDLHDGVRLGLEEGAPGAPTLLVRTVAAAGPWEALGREAAGLVTSAGALALITPPDRDVAHLLAQVGTRLSTPVISTSSAPSVLATGTSWAVGVARVFPGTPSAAGPEPRLSLGAGDGAQAPFRQRYLRRYARAPSTWSAAGYDAAQALAAAFSRPAPTAGGGPAPARGLRLRESLRSLSVPVGAYGAFELDARGRRPF